MIKKIARSLLFGLGVLFIFSATVSAADLPTEKDVQSQLEAAKNDKSENADNKDLIKDLEDTLSLLDQINQQKADNKKLEDQIRDSAKLVKTSTANIEKIKAQNAAQKKDDLTKLSINDLQKQLTDTQTNLQQVQDDLSNLNASLSGQKSAPERAQAALAENLARNQQLNKLLLSASASPALKTKYETELALLDLKNSYNQTLLSGNDELTAIYTTQVEEKNLVQQQLQTQLTQLQEAINGKYLQESKKQVEQAAQSQQENSNADTNPAVMRELELNTMISQELLKQTTQMNALSQDNLRIKSMLDNLQQTQRNIDEQISALQGTLVLSRIINKQKQALPQDQMIKDLSKQIADLRVRIFDISEFKDRTGNTDAYISDLEKSDKTVFTEKERAQLTDILQERGKILTDLIKQLNNQLNLSINIELNQQQVQVISDNLQAKLKQQSFWVKSNSQIDLDWFKSFFQSAGFQLNDLSKRVDFSGWRRSLLSAGLLIMVLLALTAFILRQKEKIKQKLTQINNQLKTVDTDSQWNTPKAIFWTLVLCLPTTLVFLSVLVLVTYLCFHDSTAVWTWNLKMTGYWLYFAFMLAMLRPNGIAYRHFNMPPHSNETFRRILKQSVWVVALLVNTSIFTNLDMGVSYDVIGQAMTIIVLVVTVFIVAPGFRQAISTYQSEKGSHTYFLSLVRILLLLAPLVLIVLIILGYYYTSLIIIEHLISTYFAVMTWIVVRNVVYRGFMVTSRRLAYRRLKEKREEALAKAAENAEQSKEADDVAVDLPQTESLAISDIKDQVLKITDFLLWTGLFALLYWVWSDLVTVAYYLDGVTLWQQNVTVGSNTTVESITLLNLLIAIIILMVTYVLIRNLGGLLEAMVFSHVKLSQGTPYTMTTLLTYLIIALGAALAFSTLGMSWSKLQWLFAALSVGLGFGMQEIFANFVSGIIILFERPVRIGDVISIGGFNGTVSKIRIRATTLVDFDGKEVIVPNKAFVTERLVNWALSNSMTRVVIKIGVAYGSDLELVKKLLLQAASECDKVLKEPIPKAFFLSFGASTLDHELRVYVDQISDRNPTVDFLNRRINRLFAEHNIEIAFNQLDVFIKNVATDEEIKLGETVELKKIKE